MGGEKTRRRSGAIRAVPHAAPSPHIARDRAKRGRSQPWAKQPKTKKTPPRRLHAPHRHPHRVVALSRRLPDANFNLDHLVRFIRTLEAAKFDAFFMADHLAVMKMPMEALKRSATVTSFDPLTLLPALAMVTERIGLIATASTTYNEPYHVARKFASLDHISKRTRGLEPRHLGQPRRGAEFRARRPSRPPGPLRPRPRVFRGRHGALGFLGRRRLRARCRGRALLRPRQAAHPRPQGRVFEG